MFGGMADNDMAESDKEIRSQESAMVRQIQHGDVHAFTAFVAQYVESVTRFAFYMLGSHDTADDIAQHVFISIWDQRHLLDPARPIRPYLFRIARNRALNEQKAIAVRERYASECQHDAGVGVESASVPNSEDSVLTSATVQAALARLPERRRLVLRLRLEDEMTHAEIGEALGMTPEAAQRLVSRALADLRKILRV